jgi:hypothetical protein
MCSRFFLEVEGGAVSQRECCANWGSSQPFKRLVTGNMRSNALQEERGVHVIASKIIKARRGGLRVSVGEP